MAVNASIVPLSPRYVAVTPSNNMEVLMTAVVQQPVVVYMDGSSAVFQNYVSGVITDPSCGNVNINHVFLLVGYGTTSDAAAIPYWKVSQEAHIMCLTDSPFHATRGRSRTRGARAGA